MALCGEGAICIWNDITPEGRADFYAWHLTEHMPERVGIPGFRRGRRYRGCAESSPEFFTLYEVDTPAVLSGEDYRRRLNAPTPWTKRATSAFRNTSRALTRVEVSLGRGSGGILATLRLAPRAGRQEELRQKLAVEVLPGLIGRGEITGAHLCVTDLAASAEKTAESRDRQDIRDPPAVVVLIEACNLHPAAEAAKHCGAAISGLSHDRASGIYRLE
jgi:hypothetical protein